MLYLISTPLGNLRDITLRALEVLKQCDYILCEDTRHSHILLQTYGIKTPLKSFHQFNEKKSEEAIIQDLREGKSIGLISDAGTPGICDPGESLVKRCYEEQLPLTALPGPSAWTMALSLCPFSKEKVQFLGFLPKKEEERKKALARALMYQGVTIYYESPQRLVSSLEHIPPQRRVCVMRELTKLHEEHRVGTAAELALYYEQNTPRGECVLLIEGIEFSYDEISLQEHVQFLIEMFQLSLSDAIKSVADIRGIPKRDVYNSIHKT